MSKDKSKINAAFFRRLARAPLPGGTAERAVHYERDAFPSSARAQTLPVCVFDDASVRLVAVGQQADDEQRYRRFVEPVLRTFAAHASVRCYVMFFDRRAYVPAEKAPTQHARTAAANKRARDDGAHAATAVETAPSSSRAERDAASARLVHALCARLAVPDGRTLLVDHAALGNAPRAIGQWSELPAAARAPTTIGEADLAAQHYARAFAPAATVLRTTDTDFLPLSLLHNAAHVHVALGRVHVRTDDDALVPRWSGQLPVGIEARYELYDVAALFRRLVAGAHLPRAAVTALCAMCGNDYVRRPLGITHDSLFRAVFCSGGSTGGALVNVASARQWRRLAVEVRGSGGRDTMRSTAIVVPATFVRLIRAAARRAGALPHVLGDHVRLQHYYDAVQWSVTYAYMGARPDAAYRAGEKM